VITIQHLYFVKGAKQQSCDRIRIEENRNEGGAKYSAVKTNQFSQSAVSFGKLKDFQK
jgi:hypothetical protein